MIISASRRTDLPAFYSRWFIECIRRQSCTTVNPFNSKQVSLVSLRPADVEVIVFWSKNPAPLFTQLDEIDRRGYRYYFQFTVTGYGRELEPHVPGIDEVLKTFSALAERIGPTKVIWRYDPVVITSHTGYDYHRRNFEYLARALEGRTKRVVISLMDGYRKTLSELKKAGLTEALVPEESITGTPEFGWLMKHFSTTAAASGMEISSCAEKINLESYGIKAGKCIDDRLIRDLFGIDVVGRKDPSQRAECGCIQSKDIGAYDSCLHGCRYCYATRTLETARKNHTTHDPLSPSLVGHHLPIVKEKDQLTLFQ